MSAFFLSERRLWQEGMEVVNTKSIIIGVCSFYFLVQ